MRKDWPADDCVTTRVWAGAGATVVVEEGGGPDGSVLVVDAGSRATTVTWPIQAGIIVRVGGVTVAHNELYPGRSAWSTVNRLPSGFRPVQVSNRTLGSPTLTSVGFWAPHGGTVTERVLPVEIVTWGAGDMELRVMDGAPDDPTHAPSAPKVVGTVDEPSGDVGETGAGTAKAEAVAAPPARRTRAATVAQGATWRLAGGGMTAEVSQPVSGAGRAGATATGRLPPMQSPGAGRTWALRAGQPEDAAAAIALWEVAGAEPTVTDDPDRVRALLAHDPRALLVAEVDGAIVGTVIAGWDGWRGNLYRLVVHPSCRRQGLGKALVEEAEGRLLARRARRVNALVVRTDERAVAFWEAVGYPFDDHIQRHVKTM